MKINCRCRKDYDNGKYTDSFCYFITKMIIMMFRDCRCGIGFEYSPFNPYCSRND
ncbi:hypothetical protein BCR32DRAFT_282788 [Anaeromyces robustus]|uniref:Uncharacterized protein n=1 Tax=Anaeromyces robustus TaxID=1754192 RepID=A0A1Y1WWS0_9FUNG|nr:hypothetical protein BCR32DRAFT_282788 [Anaeromyces robustus]|eukprot:ORX77912.1 hypothetical protein BCR32DRAFT_282788 [Anaeromyces robustus]